MICMRIFFPISALFQGVFQPLVKLLQAGVTFYIKCVWCVRSTAEYTTCTGTRFSYVFLFAYRKYKTCFGYQHTIQTVIMLKTVKLHIVPVNSTNCSLIYSVFCLFWTFRSFQLIPTSAQMLQLL